jgi:hypothetical protein
VFGERMNACAKIPILLSVFKRSRVMNACERMNATTFLGWRQVSLEIFRGVGRVGMLMGTHLVGRWQ